MSRRRGFTLVEMLVVLGIIVVLMSILIPAVVSARRQAAMTACAAKMRDIGRGLAMFMTDHRDTLPFAISSNSAASPLSAVAQVAEGFPLAEGFLAGYGVPLPEKWKYLGPAEWRAGAVPPLAWVLEPYLSRDPRVWQCPSQRIGKPGAFRPGQFVKVGDYPDRHTPSVQEAVTTWGPYRGEGFGVDEFSPSYNYMSTAELWYSIKYPNDTHQRLAKKYLYREWMARNIAGLAMAELHPSDGAPTTDVVVLMESSSVAHSRGTTEVYDLEIVQGVRKRDSYRANFLMLDGRVEGRSFGTPEELLKQVHAPIRQRWGNIVFAADPDIKDLYPTPR